MFTVIVLSDGAKALLPRSEMLFAPFEKDGDIGFCDWNQSPAALTIEQTLPGLHDLLKDKAEWRAVIVDSVRDVKDPEQRTDPENPFDYVANTNARGMTSYQELGLEVSKHPLVRVAHALLGYPEMGVKRFEPVLSYYDPESGRRVSKRQSSAAGAGDSDSVSRTLDEYQKALATENDVQIQYEEIPYTAEEQERYSALARFYRPRELRPKEVVFVSTRARFDADPALQLRRAWQVGDEQKPSRFVERNDYPSSCRFTVYDLLDPDHSAFRIDVLHFWMAVLSIAVNQLPPSAFQADRVYELRVDTNDRLLGDVLNAHLGRLVLFREHIESLLRNQEPPYDTSRQILPDQKIHLEFEALGGDELEVPTRGFGLATDVPRVESIYWQSQLSGVEVLASKFIRRPRRMVAQTIDEARIKARSYPGRDASLSRIERDELREELAKRLPALTQPSTADILNRQRLQRIMEENDDRVSACIRERMRLSSIWLATGIVFSVWFASFVPYLVLAGFDELAFSESVLVVVLALATLGLVAVGTLVWLRRRLTRLIGRFNADLRGFVARVADGAGDIAEYLTRLATYMYGTSILRGVEDWESRDRVQRREQKLLLRAANEAYAHEKAIVGLLKDVPLEIHKPKGGLADLNLDSDVSARKVFELPKGERKAEINHSGEYFAAPYDFVTRLLVSKAHVLEPARPVTRPSPDVPVSAADDRR